MARHRHVAAAAASDADPRAERAAEPPRRHDPAPGARGEHAALAQEEGVRERRHDLLGVVGDEDERRTVPAPGDAVHEPEELLPGDGIEPRARLVEDEEPRPGHERARDEDPLALALGQVGPFPAGQVRRRRRTGAASPASAVSARVGRAQRSSCA